MHSSMSNHASPTGSHPFGWGRAYPNLTLPLPAYAYWVGSMIWMALGSAFMASYYKSTRLAEVEEHLQEGAGDRWQGARPAEPGASEKIQEKSG